MYALCWAAPKRTEVCITQMGLGKAGVIGDGRFCIYDDINFAAAALKQFQAVFPGEFYMICPAEYVADISTETCITVEVKDEFSTNWELT